MSRKTRRAVSSSPDRSGESTTHDVLRRTAQFLVDTGHSPKAIARQFAQACRALEDPMALLDNRLSSFVTKLPEILGLWFTDPNFIDEHGNPLPLPLRGRGQSLSRLIGRVFPDEDAQSIAQTLVRSRSVRQQGGLFVAVAPYFSFAEELAFAQAHSLDMVSGLLGTVQHNVTCQDPIKRLLERSATNEFIPLRALPAIHRRFKRDVGALLKKMDDFMREFEVAPGSETTTRVSLGAFAAESPLMTGRLSRSKRGRTRRGNGRGSRS